LAGEQKRQQDCKYDFPHRKLLQDIHTASWRIAVIDRLSDAILRLFDVQVPAL
jgi:hypothetical protein